MICISNLNDAFVEERNQIKQANDQIRIENKKLLNINLTFADIDAKILIKEHEEWEENFEMQIFEDESKLFNRINEEEDRFVEFYNKEKSKLVDQLNELKSKLLKEQDECTANYENIRSKINDRM